MLARGDFDSDALLSELDHWAKLWNTRVYHRRAFIVNTNIALYGLQESLLIILTQIYNVEMKGLPIIKESADSKKADSI